MATGLTDMEELLERIAAGQLREFMREALVCYGAGAHRACIVLSFIAVFEDLRQKVKTAAGLNSDAKAISKDIEKLAAGQKPFETDLVNRLTAKNLLSALQSKRLHQMIDFRNKAAHPSGHYAAAEEARFVFFEAIDSYLSKPLLSSEDFAKAVLERLRGANYFPDNMMPNIENAVADEIDHLNPAAFPFLIGNLVSGATDTDADYKRNCRLFLTGLGAKKDAVITALLARQLIKAKAIDGEFREVIAANISADACVLRDAEGITRVRVNKLLVKLTKETKSSVPVTRLKHPLKVLRSMVRDLGDEEILPDYEDFVREVASTFWSNVELLRATKSEGTRTMILAEYMTRAGSNDFGTANQFAKALPDLDARLGEVLTPLEALQLLAKVWDAGETGAWDSNAMRKAKFATVPELRAATLTEINKGSKKAIAVVENLKLTLTEFKDGWLTDEV
jgi:hypothetical protein